MDDPASAIIDGSPEPNTRILFDLEESEMIEAELGFMVRNDLYYTDAEAVAIEASLAATGLETVAWSRIRADDLRGAKSATIKAISAGSLPSSWLILADICDAEGNPDQASAAREQADKVALDNGTRPEEWREHHQSSLDEFR